MSCSVILFAELPVETLGFEAGVDYLFSDHIGIGFNVEYLAGKVKTFKSGEDEIDISQTPENLGRLNLSLGVVIKL